MVGIKRKYIEATYRLLERDGIGGVSIRNVADELGCSSAALYRHFADIDRLTAVASVRFLRPYIRLARIMSQVDLNPLELNLQLWECLAYYSFQNADVFENLFFGDAAGKSNAEAISEYFEQYPEDLEGLKDFMLQIVCNNDIADRDFVLLDRASDMGMLSRESAEYLCGLDTYLFRGMLASLRGRELGNDGFREATRDFMRLLIRSYTTQLEEGYSILVVNPSIDLPGDKSELDVRSAYRVQVSTVPCGGGVEQVRVTA